LSTEYRDLYKAGIAAARARDFDRARKLFLAAVTLDEGQKNGWLALARLESDPAAKASYYRRVLAIDPRDPIARAYLDGMRHAQPWYRSRRLVGVIGLLVLLLGGSFALIVSRPVTTGILLPTPAQLPSPTAQLSIELASPLSIVSPEAATPIPGEETVSPVAPVQVTFFSLDVRAADSTLTVTPSPTSSAFIPAAPTFTQPPAVTVVVNPPPGSAPTVTPGNPLIVTVVTAPPVPTNAPGVTPTEQSLFSDVSGPPSTDLPVFATPTLDFQGDFNTEVPPTDQTFPEDPNSGGISRP
jgi:hypothetical protein